MNRSHDQTMLAGRIERQANDDIETAARAACNG